MWGESIICKNIDINAVNGSLLHHHNKLLWKKLKGSGTFLFLKGAVYGFTFNKEVKYRQSQMGIFYGLFLKEYLDHSNIIDIFVVPPDLHDVVFDSGFSNQESIERGFKHTKVGIFHHQTQYVGRNIQAQII